MDNQDPDKVISKSQLKKINRHQKWLDGRPERRRLEKEKRKLKRRALAKEMEQKGEAFTNHKSTNLMKDSINRFKVVIDMDFESYMTDNEISKSVQQVGRIYAANRHAENPFQLYVTSLKGKIRDRFSITNKGFENWDINHSELDYLNFFRKDSTSGNVDEQFLYLTGDSQETLPNTSKLLDEYQSRIFIIGGLVDHNRHKNLSYNRALERGIKTAKIPISQHIKLSQRHTLCTVSVFEILLKVLGEGKSWPEALVTSIPKRKIAPNCDEKVERDCD